MAQEIKLKTNIRVYRWIILFVATAAQASVSFVPQGIGPLAPFLESGLGLNKSQVGFAGGAVNLGISFTSLLAGKAVDMWGEKIVLVAGGFLTGGAIFLASYSKSFNMLIALLIFTGLWCAAATPAGSKVIMTWFPYSKWGLALGIRQTGIPLGGFFAALVLPIIASNHDWRFAMASMGIIPIAGSILSLALYRDHPDKIPISNNVSQNKKDWSVLRNINIWLASFTAITFVAAQFTLVSYLVLYIHDKIGLSIVRASIFLVLLQFGGIIGRIFWGFISDTIFRGARKPVLAGVGIIAMLMSITMLFISQKTPVWVIGLISIVFGFSAIGWNGLYIALVSELAGRDKAGTALGFGLTLVQLGVLIFPPVVWLYC
ncbi:MAG: MFS transporter [Desulfitobacteriaceae bacterium]